MVHIIHHVYSSEFCISIADEQKIRIEKKIDVDFKYHRNVVNKNEHELHTLTKMINEFILEFNDNDFIFYLHAKGCTHKNDEHFCLREYLEYNLIDMYKNHIKSLDMGFDTSGVLMGIPLWAENYYAGNFWWARVDSLKKIPKNYKWNMNERTEAENNFIQLIPNWNPYVFPIVDSSKLNKFYPSIISQIQSDYKIRFEN